MMIDALAMFFDKEFGSKDEFAEGLAYAEKAGRIKVSESQVWLVREMPGTGEAEGKG
jgi:hypothetical protein